MTARARAAVLLAGCIVVLAACGPQPTAAPEPAPIRPLIFIPGFAGSELVAGQGGQATVTLGDGSTKTISVSQNEVVWPHFNSRTGDLWTPLFDADYYRVLRIDNGTAPLAIRASGNLYTDMGGYGEVEPFFRDHGYAAGTSLLLFGWDWRSSVEDAAQKLDALVTSALLQPGDGKVDVVAHSAGTLVLRAFLSNGGYANRMKVAHAVLLGGPGLGAPEADDSLLVGHCAQTILFKCVLPPDPQRYAFATNPGAVQMATSANYYQYFHDQAGTHPVPYVTTGSAAAGSTDPLAYPFLENALAAHGVLGSAVISARDLHQSDLTWLAQVLRDLPAKIAIGGGSGKCALGQLRDSASVERIRIDGDTIVPRQSAVFGEDLAASYETNLPQPIPAGRLFVFVRPLEHGELSGTKGLPDTLALLRDQTPAAGTGTIVQHDCTGATP